MYEVYVISNGLIVYYIISFISYIIEIFVVDVKLDFIYFVDIGNNLLKRYDIIFWKISILIMLVFVKGNIS